MRRVDVDRILAEMTPAELVGWQAALEVVGVDPIQRQIADLAARFSAANWDHENGGPVPTVDQIMGLADLGKKNATEPIKWQTPEEIAGALKGMVR